MSHGWQPEIYNSLSSEILQACFLCQQLGQSLGSAIVDAFVNQLFQNPLVTKVQTDPSPKNERAIRCYRRAGFVAVGEVITPDGLALLMVRE
ncbi:MAG: GNAT family N-acetyltransferase [Chroococcidiopsidaceae cyanobacterium CP_BM_ER_R8_30]|nr:GNAT family N-acetyltransferase [Chroococcidiopsidaceae cyanobacterium CP_BM_ER_R8_30]